MRKHGTQPPPVPPRRRVLVGGMSQAVGQVMENLPRKIEKAGMGQDGVRPRAGARLLC
jgi:hypothetical protein